MLFTQIEFYMFAAVVILFLATVKNHTVQKRFLLLASCYFYAYWDWRCLGLILFVAIVNYYLELHVEFLCCPQFDFISC